MYGPPPRSARPPKALGAALVLLVALVLVAGACSSAAAAPSPVADIQHKADLYDIEQIEVTWHRAASSKDVDLMMSLWADNATFLVGTNTYTGKSEIRAFVAKAAPFQPKNVWVSETPAYKVKATVNGDVGTLYFQCHYVDPKTRRVVLVVGADQNVKKVHGTWLITSSTAATTTLQ
jgi:ketosteroid isomerase-like protein